MHSYFYSVVYLKKINWLNFWTRNVLDYWIFIYRQLTITLDAVLNISMHVTYAEQSELP